MSKEAKTEYLEELDMVLEPHGFSRRRNQQAWKHRVDSANECWLHVNFGLSVVNPSIGVNYLDFSQLLPEESGSVTGTMIMLSSLLKRPPLYTIESGSLPVARDLCKKGLPMLSNLRDRLFVIEALKSKLPFDWPVVSYSHRIRLLPLLLASDGQMSEALHLLELFLSESLGKDQILPLYEVFARTFRKRFAT